MPTVVVKRSSSPTNFVTAVRDAIAGIRALLFAPELPTPPADARCRRCSLLDDCLPYALTQPTRDDLFTPQPLGAWNA